MSNACTLIRSLLIVRTSHDTLLLSSAVNSMANKLVLLAMIVGSAMATNADTRNPPSFLRFARLPGINVRAFDNTTLGWNKTNWEDLKSYKKVKVCEDEDSICDSEVRWGGMTELLQNADKVHLINMVCDEFTTINPNEREIVKYKQEYCHIAFVTTSKDNHNKVFYTQNRCPWIRDKSLELADSRAIVKTLNVTDKRIFPEDCSQGPGWVGTLKNPVNRGIFTIKWASLVKHPKCVFAVKLWDRKAKFSKTVGTTWTNITFPIEYNNDTCNMEIRLYFQLAGDWRFYLTNKDVQCEQGVEKESVESTKAHNSTSTKAPAETISTVVVLISVTVVFVVVVFLVVVIAKKRKDTTKTLNQQNQRDLNDMYGTYYRDREYNVAADNNPRYNDRDNQIYNEDNEDAVFTDENEFYYKSRDDEIQNRPSSENGNIYYQL